MIAAFRVDSSSIIGAGHVIRCLSLAKALRKNGVECVFVSRDHEGNLAQSIREGGFETMLLPTDNCPSVGVGSTPGLSRWVGTSWQQDAEDTRAALEKYKINWLIVDHYGLDWKWEERLRETGANLLVIDDIADRRHVCDLLLDQNVPDKTGAYRKLVPPHCGIMSGPRYALLDPSYADFHHQVGSRRGMVQRILVYFGGGRYATLMQQALYAIAELRPEISVDAVIGQSDPSFGTSSPLANLRFHSKLPTLAPLMASADLAIGASGTSSWERCCLGLPGVVVTVAENQEPIAEELARLGIVVNLGNADGLTKEKFVIALKPLLTEKLDASWSARCLALVDGRGAERITGYMLLGPKTPLRLRRADADDEALLLRWVNDPLTRHVSLTSAHVTETEHHEWFARRLANSRDCMILIAETHSGLPVGQVRFERGEANWEISFNLDPLCRGKGAGIRTVRMAVETFWEEHPSALLSGVVKVDNLASRAIFSRMGFSEAALSDGIVTFISSKP
ncbi:UDP-2,4-diacetamido-2,4,6-trideoxy-beta-L-altropyranose hydrolase [Shinella sumterensis]|uniref:UDP-2,4-diacetamido-2,4, 6-trideoxy-beta-L-altropyranose hydrolase n=1 Tax=Shinella sumterensis TaxID=1967501 RepID=A0AA50H6X6_9HYPH|nr:UDP-2,4-diacetamido-2,4,6-trideoxy-beta-L-altropyranose hydrolase [Shinella sumterensis]WLR96184.1 UDP-2,4-diacetamido-2,4,6-trideoxy-beta-L-altropyranose hydrolase [Shinella sumterensis]